jgi:hypothetical protein
MVLVIDFRLDVRYEDASYRKEFVKFVCVLGFVVEVVNNVYVCNEVIMLCRLYNKLESLDFGHFLLSF